MAQFLDFQTNWIDLVIVGLVVAGLIFGLSQGLVRQVLTLSALYVSAVLALQYHPLVARLAGQMWPQTDPSSRQMFGLALVFAFSFLVLNLLSYYLYEETHLSTMAFIDRGGGALGGVIIGWALSAIVVNFLGLSFRFVWGGWETFEIAAQTQFNESVLVPILYSHMPALYDAMRIWLPPGLPSPFLV